MTHCKLIFMACQIVSTNEIETKTKTDTGETADARGNAVHKTSWNISSILYFYFLYFLLFSTIITSIEVESICICCWERQPRQHFSFRLCAPHQMLSLFMSLVTVWDGTFKVTWKTLCTHTHTQPSSIQLSQNAKAHSFTWMWHSSFVSCFGLQIIAFWFCVSNFAMVLLLPELFHIHLYFPSTSPNK